MKPISKYLRKNFSPVVAIAIGSTLTAQVIGVFLILSNLNLFNVNTDFENGLADLGAFLFISSPVIMLLSLIAFKLLTRVRQTKGGGKLPAQRLSTSGILLAIIFVLGPWALLMGALNAQQGYYDFLNRQRSRASNERSQQHEAAIRAQREAKWAKTCISTENISTDLQTFDDYREYNWAKLELQKPERADYLPAANALIAEINQLFKDCAAGSINPTEQRQQIKSKLQQVTNLSAN